MLLLFIIVNAEMRELPVDWDHFYPLLKELLVRVPMLNETHLDELTNSPEAFSPDCRWIIGEAPEVNQIENGHFEGALIY